MVVMMVELTAVLSDATSGDQKVDQSVAMMAAQSVVLSAVQLVELTIVQSVEMTVD